ncbi:unnamed protein product [Camellia sinensis]
MPTATPFTIVTELINMSGVEMEIREKRSQSPEGCYGEIITLDPYERREISARKFQQTCSDSLRSSLLKIFVGNHDTNLVLKPYHFIDYSRIEFRRGTDQNAEQIFIRGVRDTSSFLYRFKLRACVFLWGGTTSMVSQNPSLESRNLIDHHQMAGTEEAMEKCDLPNAFLFDNTSVQWW